MYDVAVVGGGTAGLSAALILGRARRQVLVLDGGPPRNAPARGSHGFFTRDAIRPLELLRIGREQLQPYASVEVRAVEATAIVPASEGFELVLADGARAQAHKLILATGVED